MEVFIGIIIFITGLAFGSFLNVCIYRIPRNMSLLRPPSHCPHCKRPIKPYDNIPVVSYIILKGRCRYCGARISPRYPLVELLTGLLFLAAYLKWGVSWEFLRMVVFGFLGECLAFIDGETMLVPDAITFPGIALGLLSSLLPGGIGFIDSLLGAIAGAGIMLFFMVFGKILFKKEALGDGDIFLMAFIGAFTGLWGVFYTLLFASLIGTLIGLIILVVKKTDLLPFGPFLILGAFLYSAFSNYLTIGL